MEVLHSNATTDAEAFIQAAQSALAKVAHKVDHCLDQLSDEEVWSRPRPEMNSIANLLLHLSGNLRQWVLSGAGGQVDMRNRPAEFTDNSGRPAGELRGEFESILLQCDQVLASLQPGALLETRRIQGFDVQLLAALFDTISHLQGHMQEIIHMTRVIRGRAYRFDFVPQGKEQGAPAE